MKKILICLVCALLVFSVCAFATDSDYVQNFDNVQNVADLKVKPGSGQKIEHITLDDTIKMSDSGKSLKIFNRLSFDYRLKFENSIKDLTPGTKYYISMYVTVNDYSVSDSAYVYLGVYTTEKGIYRAVYNDLDADANCKTLVTKDKWTKIGFIYTVKDTIANQIGIEQISLEGYDMPVDLNIDNIEVKKVSDDFIITDLPKEEKREYIKYARPYTKYTQIGIVKLDDLRPDDKRFERMDKAVKILEKYSVKGGLGVIAEQFETCEPKFYDKLKEWNNNGHEIWNHGLYHKDEFKTEDYDALYEVFKKAHDIIKDKTGIEMVTYGAPGNESTKTFVEMVTKEFPNYKVLLLVPEYAPSDKVFATKSIAVERDTGKPDFSLFEESYNKLPEAFVLQAHGVYFSDEGLNEFEKVIKFCVDNGIVLMTPSEYYDYEKSIKVIVDQEKLLLDAYPVIKNDRTLVPMRAIFEKLGATILWDDATKTVTAKKDGMEIKLTIDKGTALVNGVVTELDTPAIIENSRTMVPVRFISETLGKTVEWDAENKYVIVK